MLTDVIILSAGLTESINSSCWDAYCRMNLYYLARYTDKSSRSFSGLTELLLAIAASPAIAAHASTDFMQPFNVALSKPVYAYPSLKPFSPFQTILTFENCASVRTLGIGCRRQIGTAPPYFIGIHCLHDHMSHALPLQQTSLTLELFNLHSHFSAHYAFKGSTKCYQMRSYTPSTGLLLQVKYRPCKRVPLVCEFELHRKERSIHPFNKTPLRLTGTLIVRSRIHWSITAQTLQKGTIDWSTTFRVSYPIAFQWHHALPALLPKPSAPFDVSVIHRATLEIEPTGAKAKGCSYSNVHSARAETSLSDTACKGSGELLTYIPTPIPSNRDRMTQYKLGKPVNPRRTVTRQEAFSSPLSNRAPSPSAASSMEWSQKKRRVKKELVQCLPAESKGALHKDNRFYRQVLSLLELGTPYEQRISRAKLIQAHQQGKAWASFYLGKCYYHGIAYPKNLTIGATLCLQAANAGFIPAQKAILCDLLHDQRPLAYQDLARIKERFQFWIPIIQSVEASSPSYLELCQALHDAYKAGQFVEKNYLQVYKYGLSIQCRANKAFDPADPLAPASPIRIKYAHLLHAYPPQLEGSNLPLRAATPRQANKASYLKAMKKFNTMYPNQLNYKKVVQTLLFCLGSKDYDEQRKLTETVLSNVNQRCISFKAQLQAIALTEGLLAVSKSQQASSFQRSFAYYLLAIQCITERTCEGSFLALSVTYLLEAAQQAYPPAIALLTHLLNTVPDTEGRMELHLFGKVQYIAPELYAIAIRKLRSATQGSSIVAEMWANRNFYL